MPQQLQLGLLLVVVCSSAGCGSRAGADRGPVAVLDASRGAVPTELLLTVGTCHGGPTATVVESATQISARVTSTRTTGSSSACADGVALHLASPVGSRSFRDQTSGTTWELAQP